MFKENDVQRRRWSRKTAFERDGVAGTWYSKEKVFLGDGVRGRSVLFHGDYYGKTMFQEDGVPG